MTGKLKHQLLLLSTIFLANNAIAQSVVAVSEADFPKIKIAARTNGIVKTDSEAIEYQWPGVYFSARFKGSEIGFKIDDEKNKFKISIDNKEVGRINAKGLSYFKVIDIPKGMHEIRIDKISESQGHSGRFIGFYTDAGFGLNPPIPKKRKIEFIGDSYSVGYGNLSKSHKCSRDELFEMTDNSKAFGPLVANSLGADYQINAYSGIGIVRNYNNSMFGKPMEFFYGKSSFKDEKPNSENDFHPDIINILLGTNDFSTKIKPDEKWKDIEALKQDYVDNYAKFIKKQRAKNPRALILISVNIDANQNHMAAFMTLKDLMKSQDKKLKFVILPATNKTGCDWHPDIGDHAAMAQILIENINDFKHDW